MREDKLELVTGGTLSTATGAKLRAIRGNPEFKDQFNLNFNVLYTEAIGIGAPALIAPAALPAALQNQLPVFLFGNSDYAGGFDKINGFFPLTTWVRYSVGVVAGYDYGCFNDSKFSNANVQALFIPFLNHGDLFFQFYALVAGNTYNAIVIVRCPQVAYGSLLDSINSDVFQLNMIRYNVLPASLNQLRNNILILKKSIFGKSQHDWIDPNVYVTGKTFNTNIADIPLEIEIDKSKGMGFYINFDAGAFHWSITVRDTKKITL